MAITMTINTKNIFTYPSPLPTDILLDSHAPAPFPIAKTSPFHRIQFRLIARIHFKYGDVHTFARIDNDIAFSGTIIADFMEL